MKKDDAEKYRKARKKTGKIPVKGVDDERLTLVKEMMDLGKEMIDIGKEMIDLSRHYL